MISEQMEAADAKLPIGVLSLSFRIGRSCLRPYSLVQLRELRCNIVRDAALLLLDAVAVLIVGKLVLRQDVDLRAGALKVAAHDRLLDAVNPSSAYTHMKTLLHHAGLPSTRFHDLHHTFVTHALTSGVDAKTLSGILGHTNASFTLDTYTHVTSDMQKQACGIVGGFMEDIFGKELKPWQENEKPATEP